MECWCVVREERRTNVLVSQGRDLLYLNHIEQHPQALVSPVCCLHSVIIRKVHDMPHCGLMPLFFLLIVYLIMTDNIACPLHGASWTIQWEGNWKWIDCVYHISRPSLSHQNFLSFISINICVITGIIAYENMKTINLLPYSQTLLKEVFLIYTVFKGSMIQLSAFTCLWEFYFKRLIA